MSDKKNYFLLLRENEGKIKKGGWRSKEDEFFTALPGSLYKERTDKTANNKSILSLVSITNDEHFLDVTYDNALELNEKELQLLLTLGTDNERYEMGHTDRNHLKSASKAKVGDVVFIGIGNGVEQHCVIRDIRISKAVGKLTGRYFMLKGDKIPPEKAYRFDEIATFVPDVENDIPEKNNKCEMNIDLNKKDKHDIVMCHHYLLKKDIKTKEHVFVAGTICKESYPHPIESNTVRVYDSETKTDFLSPTDHLYLLSRDQTALLKTIRTPKKRLEVVQKKSGLMEKVLALNENEAITFFSKEKKSFVQGKFCCLAPVDSEMYLKILVEGTEKLVRFDKVTFNKEIEKTIPEDVDKKPNTNGEIDVGSKVVVPIKNKFKDEIEYKHGKVKILHQKPNFEILCGVETDDKISNSLGNYLNNKKIFDCKLGHGIIVDINEVIPIEAYHPNEDKKENTLNDACQSMDCSTTPQPQHVSVENKFVQSDMKESISTNNDNQQNFINEILSRIYDWKAFARVLKFPEHEIRIAEVDIPETPKRNEYFMSMFCSPNPISKSWSFWRKYLLEFDNGRLLIKELETKFVELMFDGDLKHNVSFYSIQNTQQSAENGIDYLRSSKATNINASQIRDNFPTKGNSFDTSDSTNTLLQTKNTPENADTQSSKNYDIAIIPDYFGQGSETRIGKSPKNNDFNFNDASLYGEQSHKSPTQHNELPKVSNMENEFGVGSMVQFQVRSSVVTGCIKWIGFIKVFGDKKMAGIELDEDQLSIGNCNGSVQGEIYFSCRPGRGIFLPLTKLKKDSRFEDNNTSSHRQVISAQNNLNIVTEHQPYITNVDKLIGKWHGIQGHLNSCYMDATLFAMFACSDVFDSALYNAKVSHPSDRYNRVQEILKYQIINPLRKDKYISAKNIQELRHHLDAANESKHSYMGDEQDVEEFVNLLFDKILGFPPFITIWSEKNNSTFSTHLHQIFVSDFESQPLPSVQYLLDKSFLEGDMYLEKVPDIMILHMPRNAKEKIFPKIQVKSTIDLSSVLKGAPHWCVICNAPAEVYCSQCSSLFGKDNIYPFMCTRCLHISHLHPSRMQHNRASVRSIPLSIPNIQQQQQHENQNKMELFAVLCIELSHYVSFVRCNDSWVFFDSMADRIGEKDGYNIPSVQEVGNLDAFLDAPPLRIANLKDPKKMSHTARFFEDVYMCFYRRIVEPHIYANNFQGNSNLYENMQNKTYGQYAGSSPML